ncbi:MAG: hypothetical protein HY832_03940 [Candidatus Aenigmarchaeota archaeon]|nr:hypothetical protein [Candidatus Aenigmarchaeota archaeon]
MRIAIVGPATRDVIDIRGSCTEHVGGTVYYTAYALHALGVDATVFAKIAPADRELLNAFTCRVVPVWSQTTTIYKNSYPKENRDYREQSVDAVAEPFTGNDVADVHNFDIVHLGPLNKGDIPLAVIEQLRKHNTLISLDAQGYLRDVSGSKVIARPWTDAASFLLHIDILKCDEHEAALIVGNDMLEEMARRIAALGPREVIITRGSKGSVIFSHGTSTTIPAISPERIVDVTGTGDTYMGGYLAKRLETDDVKTCGTFAATIASKRISGLL